MSSTAEFVFIHGGCHRASCWDLLLASLLRQGRNASAVDLPGYGRDPAIDPRPASLDDGIAAVVAHIERIDGPIMLVGHSLGGMTISGVGEAIPERIECLVYLSAFLPADGQSAATLSEQIGFTSDASSYLCEGGTQAAVRPEMAHHIFYQDCPDEISRNATASLCTTDIGYLVSPVRLSAGRFGRLPKTYIACLDDQAVGIDIQRAMIDSSPGIKVEELASGHSPFLSMPDELAAVLCRL